MSQRNRGSETTIQVIVDGDLKNGSWAKITDFELTPKQEVTETQFLGEMEDDHDFGHYGWGLSFTCQELDQKLRDVMFDLVSREQGRAAYPAIQIVVTIKHRAGQNALETLVLGEVVFKFDSLSMAGKKDYLNTKISGFCKTVDRQ